MLDHASLHTFLADEAQVFLNSFKDKTGDLFHHCYEEIKSLQASLSILVVNLAVKKMIYHILKTVLFDMIFQFIDYLLNTIASLLPFHACQFGDELSIKQLSQWTRVCLDNFILV